jgi:hypothetical protein
MRGKAIGARSRYSVGGELFIQATKSIPRPTSVDILTCSQQAEVGRDTLEDADKTIILLHKALELIQVGEALAAKLKDERSLSGCRAEQCWPLGLSGDL